MSTKNGSQKENRAKEPAWWGTGLFNDSPSGFVSCYFPQQFFGTLSHQPQSVV